MRTSLRSITIPLALTALLAACSGGGAGTATPARTSAAPAATSAAPAATSAPAASPSSATSPAGGGTIKVTESSLGPILTDASGKTLYAFTKDTDGNPTCYDQCEANWPPLVDADATAGEGADQAKISTVARKDGSMQVKYGDWPLYYYAKDTAAGQTTGQNVGEVWFVVAPSGELVKEAGGGGIEYGIQYGY